MSGFNDRFSLNNKHLQEAMIRNNVHSKFMNH